MAKKATRPWDGLSREEKIRHLFEYPAEITGRPKTAFPADFLYRIRSGRKKLLCFFQPEIQQIADWRLIHISLEASGGFTFADACGSGNLV